MRYVYPAIFTKEEKGYSVIFPDLEGCYTCGDDMNDALFMASDVLAFTLFDYEKFDKPIPAPSEYADLKISENDIINYVACDTIEYQKLNNNKAVKKTLSVPEWLNEAAQAKGINFSQVLQDALKEKLGY